MQLHKKLVSEAKTILARQVYEIHWKEVFLLLSEMPESSNQLIYLIDQQIKALILQSEKLYEYLVWVNQKSLEAIQELHLWELNKVAIVRAFYFTHGLALNADDNDIDFNLQFIGLDEELNNSVVLYTDTHEYYHCFNFDRSLTCAYVYAHYGLKTDFGFINIVSHLEDAIENETFFDFDLYFPGTKLEEKYTQLQKLLLELKNELPFDKDEKLDQKCWQLYHANWAWKLRLVMRQYRNIGHDWQFSQHDKELIKQYYNGNKLLLACLNSDCSISDDTKKKIEENLLLPII